MLHLKCTIYKVIFKIFIKLEGISKAYFSFLIITFETPSLRILLDTQFISKKLKHCDKLT